MIDEYIIQADYKQHLGQFVYYLVPCPQFGVTAKCGNQIESAPDYVWDQIKKYAATHSDPAKYRIKVVTKPEIFEDYEPITVLEVEVIDER